MTGGKAKKNGVERSMRQLSSIDQKIKSDGPLFTTEISTIDHTITFGMEKQRKVYPVCSITMKRMDLHADRIHVVSNVLLAEECEYFISWGEERGFEEFKQPQSREYAHRENGRIQYEDPILAQRIYERISLFLPSEIDRLSPRGCSSNIRLYRYTAGQSFGKHIDEAHPDEAFNGMTKYTLLIYLSGHRMEDSSGEESALEQDNPAPGVTCTGGETVFYKNHSSNTVLLSVAPEPGKLLLHGHGAKCLTHEGSAVMSGVKYVLRTDVVYG